MSNHSPEFDKEMEERLSAIMREPLIGATGLHTEGKLTEQDEGGIQFAVGVQDGKVVLDFGTPVAWLGMRPEDALKVAESLIQNARKAAKGQGSILTLNI